MKYYEQYKKHDLLFGCFIFILKNNFDFNYNIIINIMYIKSKLVLYLVNKKIYF